MFKHLIKAAHNVFGRIFKMPYRLKSKLHDEFHCTLNQIHNRTITELSNKGLSKNEIIEKISGKKLSELNKDEINMYTEWLDKKQLELSRLDDSFNNVIPTLFTQKYYRGLNSTPAELQALKKGDIFTDYGYSWYSPQKSCAEDFSRFVNGKSNPKDCTIIETIIPRKTKVSRDINVNIDGITGLNPFRSMNIVVPRNKTYEVLDKEIKDNRTYLKIRLLRI